MSRILQRVLYSRRLEMLGRVVKALGLVGVVRAGRWLLRAGSRGRLDVTVDDLTIVGPVEHRGYLRELWRGHQEPFMTHLFKEAVRPGMVVLDVGAFLGQYSLLAAREVGDAGRVYAFEPDRRSFVFLLENLRRNGLDGRVTAVPKAVADRTGPRPLFSDQRDQSISSLFAPPVAPERVTDAIVDCVRLDDFLDASVVVDVMKLDVEGSELLALDGMTGVLGRGARGLKLFVECFPAGLRAAHASPGALLARLGELGFTAMRIDEDGACLRPIDLVVEHAQYTNLFCVRTASLEDHGHLPP